MKIRYRTIGQCFGTVAQIVSGRQILAESQLRPFGFTSAALADVQEIAAKHGWVLS